jgi:uncharacterized protein Usg
MLETHINESEIKESILYNVPVLNASVESFEKRLTSMNAITLLPELRSISQSFLVNNKDLIEDSDVVHSLENVWKTKMNVYYYSTNLYLQERAIREEKWKDVKAIATILQSYALQKSNNDMDFYKLSRVEDWILKQ